MSVLSVTQIVTHIRVITDTITDIILQIRRKHGSSVDSVDRVCVALFRVLLSSGTSALLYSATESPVYKAASLNLRSLFSDRSLFLALVQLLLLLVQELAYFMFLHSGQRGYRDQWNIFNGRVPQPQSTCGRRLVHVCFPLLGAL